MTIKTLFKLTLFSLFSLLSSTIFAAPPGLHHASQDDYGIVLELNLADFTFHTMSGADNLDYQRLEVAQPWAKMGQVGYPELPFTATLLQVPPAGELQVEILEQVSDTMSVARLYPTPQPRVSQNGDIVQHFVKNAAAYTSQAFYPSSLITLDKRALWRDVPTVRVNVYPFQWNPHTQQLRYTTYLRFRVRFSEPLPPSSATEAPATAGFEPLLRSVIPGYQSRQSPTRLQRQEMGSPQWPYRYSVNLSIKNTGMYRITGEELSASGMPTECFSQGQLRLYQQGQPVVPQRVAYSHRWFGLQDSLVFYAHSVENTFSNTNIYRLDCWQLSRSRPLPTVSPEAKLFKWGNVLDGTVKGTGQPVTNFQEKVRIEENLLMDDMLPGAPQQDYWFWEQLEAPANQEISIPVMMPDTASKNAEAYIRVGLRGVSTTPPHPNHHTRISLNQTKIEDYTWDGDKENVQKFSISPTLLKHGDNTLRIDSLDDIDTKKVDVTYTNWVEIVYPRQLVATQDQLKFSLTGKGRQIVQVTQFSTPDISVYDITDPTDLKEIINVTVAPSKIGYQVTFEDYINPEKTYYALTTPQLRPADSLVLLPSSTLKQPTNGADYLLITAKEFLPAAQPLLERRSQQGLRVMGVSIEDIYNEFGFGFRTPQALKDFLAYAYQNWQPPAPAYVFLLGDSSLDYKGYLVGEEEKKINIIPPYMISTIYNLAPNDNWYVTLQGDDVLPEMMIGRLPSSNVEEVKQMVDKIIQYETDTQISPSVLLVADNDPSFEAASEKVVSQIPPTVTLNKLYLGQYQDDNQATLDLLNYLELGVSITQYLGHGNETVWANAQGQKLLEVKDLITLNDTGNLTFLVVLNCLNANFSDVKRHSLAEQFLLAKDKGAFASFAPTSVGYLWEHQLLDAAFFELLFKENRRLLGELTTQAKVLAYSRGTSELGMNTFVLLGDPASTLYLPVE